MLNANQSRVKMFRRCQKQYSFRYDYPAFLGKEGQLELVPRVSKLPLYRGSWMHALQQALHHQWAGIDKFTFELGEGRNSLKSEVKDWKDVHKILTDEFEKLFLEEREELGDLPTECEKLFRGYLRFWKDDMDRYTVATLPTGEPAIEFMVTADLSKFGIKGAQFKGKIDLVVEDDEYESLWMWDAKWVKNIPSADERTMSPQAPLYVWALRETFEMDVQGFMYNYGRTKPPSEPQVLKRPAGMLSTKKNMDTDIYTYFAAIKRQHGKDYKNYLPYYATKLKELKGRDAKWFDRQRIPVEDEKILRAVREYIATVRDIQRRESRPDYVPRSYFYTCRRFCEFHDLCVSEYEGLDIEPLVKANFIFSGERYGKEDLLAE